MEAKKCNGKPVFPLWQLSELPCSQCFLGARQHLHMTYVTSSHPHKPATLWVGGMTGPLYRGREVRLCGNVLPEVLMAESRTELGLRDSEGLCF